MTCKLSVRALVALFCVSMGSFIMTASASNISLKDMSYKPPAQREHMPAPKADLVFDGKLVAFAEVKVHKTKGLTNALKFIDAQTQLSQLRRRALSALTYTSQYIIENADDSVKLQEFSKTVSDVSACGYFGFDQEIAYVVEGIFSRLVASNIDYKNNLISGSLNQADLTPLNRNKHDIEDEIMSCSKNLELLFVK